MEADWRVRPSGPHHQMVEGWTFSSVNRASLNTPEGLPLVLSKEAAAEIWKSYSHVCDQLEWDRVGKARLADNIQTFLWALLAELPYSIKQNGIQIWYMFLFWLFCQELPWKGFYVDIHLWFRIQSTGWRSICLQCTSWPSDLKPDSDPFLTRLSFALKHRK